MSKGVLPEVILDTCHSGMGLKDLDDVMQAACSVATCTDHCRRHLRRALNGTFIYHRLGARHDLSHSSRSELHPRPPLG